MRRLDDFPIDYPPVSLCDGQEMRISHAVIAHDDLWRERLRDFLRARSEALYRRRTAWEEAAADG